jgi:hypothetical protein
LVAYTSLYALDVLNRYNPIINKTTLMRTID